MDDTFNVFVYGTLMFEECFRGVTNYDGPLDAMPACLTEFERRSVPHGCYPAIIHKEGGEVNGILIKDLPAEVLAYLDRYEGEGSLYLRKQVTVEGVKAWAYVWPHGEKTLANGDWEFDVKDIMTYTPAA